MTNICRKTRLAQSLELMKKRFPREYSFYPTTYVLPQNLASFKNVFSSNGQSKVAYIIKPDGSAQGKGIFLTKCIDDVENLNIMCVAQQYIKNPLLIDKKKFDLRIYVLTTSCSPLRIYLFRDGLVRICTEEYKTPNSTNMDDKCMHLTNYAVNKRSEKYERDEGSNFDNRGSKRSISWLLNSLSKERGDDAAKGMWAKVGDICVMSIISILPTLQREYNAVFEKKNKQSFSTCSSSTESSIRTTSSNSNESDCPMHRVLDIDIETSLRNRPIRSASEDAYNGQRTPADESSKSRCFEILGIDIMIDDQLTPYLIEVNHLPSWGTDSPIDDSIKSRVITQALAAIKVNARERYYYDKKEKKSSRSRLRRCSSGENEPPSYTVGGNSTGKCVAPPFGRKKDPVFFDSNSAERRIRSIYQKYAPEKLAKVKDLLEKFRGYEEWLAKKIEEKYSEERDHADEHRDDDESDSSSGTSSQESSCNLDYKDLVLEEEERILQDYDRIYPPSKKGLISASRYKEMVHYITETDASQQRRLSRPLHQLRSTIGDVSANIKTSGRVSRSDSWIGGNVHVRPTKEGPKIVGPPTKQQLQFADRLSRGFSVASTHTESDKNKRAIQDECDEDNPFYLLVDRVEKSREYSKEARRRAEMKLSKRLQKGIAIKQQSIELDFEMPLTAIYDQSSLHAKKRCSSFGRL